MNRRIAKKVYKSPDRYTLKQRRAAAKVIWRMMYYQDMKLLRPVWRLAARERARNDRPVAAFIWTQGPDHA